MTILISALLEIVRFLFALPVWVAVLQLATASFAQHQTDSVIPPSPNAWNPLHYVASAGEQTVLVWMAYPGSKDRALYREITSGSAEPLRVRIPLNIRMSWTVDDWSDALITNGSDWWYATLDDRDDAPAVTFVKSDGSRATYAKPPELVAGGSEAHSFPISAIPGEKPRVIAFNFKNEETIAVEIDLEGVKRSWRLPAIDFSKFVGRVIAEPLPDGRIALLDNHNGRINMHLLTDKGQVESISLRDLTVRELDADLDSGGRIEIVVRRKDTGAIEAALVDPVHPNAAQWRTLAPDTQLMKGGHGLRVVATPGGHAAAWLNDTGVRRLEAVDIDRRGHPGPVVEIGRPYSRGETFFDMQAKQDELLFWWDDDGRVVERHLPASLTGYAAMTALEHFLRVGTLTSLWGAPLSSELYSP